MVVMIVLVSALELKLAGMLLVAWTLHAQTTNDPASTGVFFLFFLYLVKKWLSCLGESSLLPVPCFLCLQRVFELAATQLLRKNLYSYHV